MKRKVKNRGFKRVYKSNSYFAQHSYFIQHFHLFILFTCHLCYLILFLGIFPLLFSNRNHHVLRYLLTTLNKIRMHNR